MADGHTVGAESSGLRIPEEYEELVGFFQDEIFHELSEEQRVAALGRLATALTEHESARTRFVESNQKGVFVDAANYEARFIPDYERLGKISETFKDLGESIVLTSGTFDIIHLGHARYIEAARQRGSVLVVGVDSDDKVRSKKGPKRPVVSEDERLQMLSHLRGVNLLTLKTLEHEHWELIKTIKPNVLIATEGTYSADEVDELEGKYCDRVEVLPPQATSSTTARIRLLQLDFGGELGEEIIDAVQTIINSRIHGENGESRG